MASSMRAPWVSRQVLPRKSTPVGILNRPARTVHRTRGRGKNSQMVSRLLFCHAYAADYLSYPGAPTKRWKRGATTNLHFPSLQQLSGPVSLPPHCARTSNCIFLLTPRQFCLIVSLFVPPTMRGALGCGIVWDPTRK